MNPWLLAIRPKTLPAVISPLLVGNVLAFKTQTFSLSIMLISLICGIFLQISVNLANDYFDFKNGIDTKERVGPKRVTQSGELPANKVKFAMYLSLALALLIGSILIYYGGWPIAVLAILATFGALGYSGGPYPLASHGLGEIAAFLFFGLIAVIGSYYIQTQNITTLACILAASLGFFNAAIMLVNNTRDIKTDEKADKITISVKIGVNNSIKLYCILLSLPFLLIFFACIFNYISIWALILTSFTGIYAVKLAYNFKNLNGIEYNKQLALTAMLTLIYSVVFSITQLYF